MSDREFFIRLRDDVVNKWNAYADASNSAFEEGDGFRDDQIHLINLKYKEWQEAANKFHTFLAAKK